MHFLDILTFVIYFVILVCVGMTAAKGTKDFSDFAIAGGKMYWPIVMASMSASYIGGGASIGGAGMAAEVGYAYYGILGAFALQMIIVGNYISPLLKGYKGAYTVADVMGYHYGRIVRAFTGVLSVGVCAGIMGAQISAIGAITETLLGIPFLWGAILGTILMLIYTVAGGISSVMRTDTYQFVILGISIPSAFYFLVKKSGITTTQLIASLPDTSFTFLGDMPWTVFLSTFIAFLLGETLVPPYASRSFTAVDSKHARKGVFISGIFDLFWSFTIVTLGVYFSAVHPGVTGDPVLPTLIKNYLPVAWRGVAFAGLVAVLLSTGDSYLNSTATSFVQDIWIPFIKPDTTGKQALSLARIITFIAGVGALIFALKAPSVIDALIYSYYLWAPTIIIPLVYAVIKGKASPYAGFSAIVAGAIATIIWTWVLHEPYGLSGLLIGVISNAVVFFIVESLTNEKTDYNVKGLVPEYITSNNITLEK